MGKTIRNFLRGMGSVLEIMPSGRLTQIGKGVLAKSSDQAIRSDWNKVGQDLRSAIGAADKEMGHDAKSR